jgi:hypothetical protein
LQNINLSEKCQPSHLANEGSAVLGLQVVDVAADFHGSNPNNSGSNKAASVMAEAVAALELDNNSRAGRGDGGNGGGGGGIVNLANRHGQNPRDNPNGGGGGGSGNFGDGLVKGEDALLSFDAPGGAPFEVEVEIVSVLPRLLVRLPAWCSAAAVRSAAPPGVAAWRLDRLAYRAVLTRRLVGLYTLKAAEPIAPGFNP